MRPPSRWHPLDTLDRRDELRRVHGLGFCNITKCCTDICPEGIKITDNAIIPLKERVADEAYDPLQRLLGRVFGRQTLAGTDRAGKARTGS